MTHLAGPTRAGRLAGKDGPSACSSQNMHGSAFGF